MRVDIVSIFPEYFAPLDLSLVGKARANGARSSWPYTICGPGPTTCTARSTTRPTAAGPAW